MAGAEADQTKKRSSFFSGPVDIAGPRLALVLAVFFLCVLGLVVVFSASSIEAINEGLSPAAYVVRQAVNMLVGVIFCVCIVVFIPYDWWHGKLLSGVWFATIVLLLLTAAIGTVGLGAQRWVTIAGISGQPSEFAKVAFILMAARIVFDARNEDLDFNSFALQVGIFVALPLFVLYTTQSDLGTTAICLVGILAVVFLSGAEVRTIAVFVLGLLLFGIAAVAVAGYRSDRLSFLNPEADYYGSGYQLTRSYYAFGEGGLFGVGLGNSTEKYLYLPEAETDFIFAIVGEEMGLIGALLVVCAFLVILWAGLRIAKAAPDLFGTLIAGGCTTMLVFQAFLNIGCVTGLLPTTGKPLPFMSSGGSSLIGSLILIGLILSVSVASGGTSVLYDKRRNNLEVIRSASPARKASAATASSSSRKAKNTGTSKGRSKSTSKNRTSRSKSKRG